MCPRPRPVGDETDTEEPADIGFSWFLFVPILWLSIMATVGFFYAHGRDRFTAVGIALTSLSVLMVTPASFGGSLILEREKEWLKKVRDRPVAERERRRALLDLTLRLGKKTARSVVAAGALILIAAIIVRLTGHHRPALTLAAVGLVLSALGSTLVGIVRLSGEIAGLFVPKHPAGEQDIISLAEFLRDKNEPWMSAVGAIAFFTGVTMLFLGVVT